jgi:hypothetical protein
VQDSEKLRKHDLECLRLASDCMQLAGDVRSSALQRHFLRMAKVWTAQAEQGPDADPQEIRLSQT